MAADEVNHERLIQLRQEGALRVCEKLGASALVATQHDNVQYVADVRRFFVYGWEPNSLALISKEGAVRSLDCGLHVAPGPHWANDGAALKEQTGWDHYSVFNASLIHEHYATWVRDSLKGLGVTSGKVGVDRVSWVILEAFRAAMPGIEFVNAEEALLFERIAKNEEERKLMRKAAWVASEGVQAGLDALAPGVTEYEVYGAFMGRMYARLGRRRLLPLPDIRRGDGGGALPDEPRSKEGDAIIMDMGPIVEGYNGDCMRTGFVGEPTSEFKELYRQLRGHVRRHRADPAGRPHLGGRRGRAQDGRVLRLHAEPLRHRPRHRAQLLRAARVHEGGVGARSSRRGARAGMCFTLEPRFHKMVGAGTYIQAALEETVMVSDDGVEILTTTPFLDECLAATV